MLRSFFIGLVAGQRALTPLALVTGAARRDLIEDDWWGGRLARNPWIAAGSVVMAAAEMAGDKMKSAPDRTVIAGLIPRAATSAFAGAALAPRDRRTAGAALAAATALASSFLGLALRKPAMRHFGQTGTGFVEDAAVLGAGARTVGLI
ncbi:DUF4126 domain-containing protein [Sphingomonas sp. ID1715]|uniref:DUF4126 domain-containing protein n=1 Tax=Sphingomonas sp. ID1715 TaxID=1656898 RepID=UPI00148800E8|nr:DUF4126 domain-containing protein [Sphingomonas sp. ID1715]NNM75928.1 DUF4126 domain-containing protein [Sphingomonas sp. ID1715]